MRRKRILIISLLHFENLSVGVAKSVQSQYYLLKKYRYHVNFFSPHKDFIFYFLLKFLSLFIFNKLKKIDYIDRFKINIIKNYLNKNLFLFDIIICHDPTIAFAALELNKEFKFNIKIILNAHYNTSKLREYALDGFAENSTKIVNYKDQERKLLNLLDLILFNSKKSLENFKKHYQVTCPHDYVYNVISHVNYTKEIIDKRIYKIINVGYFDETKNTKETILIFNELIKLNPNFTLDIFGTGPLKKELSLLVNKLSLNKKVTFKGIDKKLDYYFHNYDFLIHTSLYESFGNVIAEALRSKVVVFAYNSGAINEIITDKITGFIIDKDFKKSAKLIHNVSNNLTEIELITKEGFIKYSNTFSQNAIYNKIKKFLF